MTRLNRTTRRLSRLFRAAPNSPGMIAPGLMPAVLLHGTGAAGYDEIAIFGGIGLIIVGLIFMSWRAGRQRKRRERSRRR